MEIEMRKELLLRTNFEIRTIFTKEKYIRMNLKNQNEFSN
jgi:hypothetical protein